MVRRFALAAVLAHVLVGCPAPSPSGRCLTNADCDGARVCLAGQCSAAEAGVRVDSGLDATSQTDAASDGGAIPCTSDPQCDDMDPCNGFEHCVVGRCAPGTPLDCNDHSDCTEDRCQPGGCVHAPLAAGTTCDDGSSCTVGDVCAAGACVGRLDCDDRVDCTVDSCETVCTHLPNDMVCSGGMTARRCDPSSGCVPSTCTTSSCVATGPCDLASCDMGGACVHRSACDDGNACTGDSCSGGMCMHAAILGTPCDDGNICTVGDTCASTGCVGAAGVDLRACGMGGVCCGVMCVAPGTC